MEIQISQDIRKYKTKDIGNFNFKEAGFIVCGLAAGFLTYKLTGSIEAAVFPLGVVVIFGFLKPYGMSFFTFLRTVGKETLMPQCYINETDFEYDLEEIREQYGDEYVIPAEWDVIQTPPVKINKQDKLRIIT